jgi:hypothetical protein
MYFDPLITDVTFPAGVLRNPPLNTHPHIYFLDLSNFIPLLSSYLFIHQTHIESTSAWFGCMQMKRPHFLTIGPASKLCYINPCLITA